MKSSTRAFTLIELFIAIALLALVSIGFFMMLMSTMKMYAFNSAQLQLVTHVRKLTNELAQNAEFSNYFVILPNFDSRTRLDGGKTVINAVDDGSSGNCLVLVFKDPDDNTKISRVMGYYWVLSGATEGDLYKFDSGVYAVSKTDTVWDLMPATGTKLTNQKLADHVTPPSGVSVFYNFYNRSVITNCEIVEQATSYKNASFTYNFTVSPRG